MQAGTLTLLNLIHISRPYNEETSFISVQHRKLDLPDSPENNRRYGYVGTVGKVSWKKLWLHIYILLFNPFALPNFKFSWICIWYALNWFSTEHNYIVNNKLDIGFVHHQHLFVSEIVLNPLYQTVFFAVWYE